MTMPDERARALRWAGEFLRELRSVELPEHIKRQIPYVLRHYPSTFEIATEAKLQASVDKFSSWLAPEEGDKK